MSLVSAVREPTVPSDHPPLLVLLHGIGADELDLLPVADALDPRLLAVSLRAPHDAEPMGYAWYALDWSVVPPAPDLEQAGRSLEELAAALPELERRSGAEPSRTFLFGFSQGATMALGLALTRPELVRGVILHSGRVLQGLERRAAPAERLAGLEALVLHGVHDDVLPVERGRETRDLLARLLGPRLEYREHDAGHFVTRESIGDVARWLGARIAA
ncbi:MAG TPA: alpha/beta hydrolase-fold protein [Anaeromyxobacter sp.]